MHRYIIPLISLLLLLTACRDREEPDMPTPYQTLEIATFLGQDDKGSDWEIQRISDISPRRLHTSQTLEEELTPGRRLLVYFRSAMADTALNPMPVTLLQVGAVAFDTVKSRPLGEIRLLPRPQLTVTSQWLTGDYINMQTLMEYDGNTRGFGLVANMKTLDADTLECYLYLTGEEVTPDYVNRRVYGSFYLGNLKRNPAQAIRLHTEY